MVFGSIPDWNRTKDNLLTSSREYLLKEYENSNDLKLTNTLKIIVNERISSNYSWSADPGQHLLSWFAIHKSNTPEKKECQALIEIRGAISATWSCEPLFSDFLGDCSPFPEREYVTAEMMMHRKLREIERRELFEAKGFIQELLQVVPSRRLNGSTPEAVKGHAFFNSSEPGARRIDWGAIANGSAPPADEDFDRSLGCIELLGREFGALSDEDVDALTDFDLQNDCVKMNEHLTEEYVSLKEDEQGNFANF